MILKKVVKQQKMINLNAVIIQFYFQCAWMMINNISTSGGLTAYIFSWCVLLLHEMFVVKCPRRSIGLSDWYEKVFVVSDVKSGALLMVLSVVWSMFTVAPESIMISMWLINIMD